MSSYYESFLSLLQPSFINTSSTTIKCSPTQNETNSIVSDTIAASESRDQEDDGVGEFTVRISESMDTLRKTLSDDFDSIQETLSNIKDTSFVEKEAIVDTICSNRCSSQNQNMFAVSVVSSSERREVAVNDRLSESMASLRESMKYDARQVISSHDTTGSSNNAMSKSGKQKGYDKALRCYHEALVETKKLVGPNHPEVADVHMAMAFALKKKLLYDDSLKAFRKALDIYETTSVDKYSDRETKRSFLLKSVETLNNIGNVLFQQGKLNSAMEEYRKALYITKTSIPEIAENNSDSSSDYKLYLPKSFTIQRAETLNNIAMIYTEKKQITDAIQYHRLALDLQGKCLAEDDPAISNTFNKIGIAHFKNRQYEKALKWFKKVLKMRRSASGRDHDSVGDVCNNIGLCFSMLDDYEGARKAYLEALKIYREALGRNHVKVADIYGNIGFLAENYREEKEANYHLGRARKIYKANGLSNYHTFVIAVTRDNSTLLKSPKSE